MKNIISAILLGTAIATTAFAQVQATPAPAAAPSRPTSFNVNVGWAQDSLALIAVKALQETAGSAGTIKREPTAQGPNSQLLVFSGQGEEPQGMVDKLRARLETLQRETFPLAYAMDEPIDFAFSGGTVEQFLAALFPGNIQVNIVYATPDVKTASVPAVSLKRIQRRAVMDLVPSLSPRSDGMLGQSSGRLPPGAYTVSFLNDRDLYSVGEIPTLIVRSSSSVRRSDSSESAREPIVLRIAPADATSDSARLDQEKAQQAILKAIDDGIALRGGSTPDFKVKLNPATGILFVQGSTQEKALVSSVIKAMAPDKTASVETTTPPTAPSQSGETGERGRARNPSTTRPGNG